MRAGRKESYRSKCGGLGGNTLKRSDGTGENIFDK